MITTTQVWDEVGTPDPGPETPDGRNMVAIVSAVNVLVPNTVPRVRKLEPGADWPGDVVRGAVMQAARLFARRNSPTGVASYSDTGAAYVARWDPDMEKLLLIGSWAVPVAR